MGSATSSRGSFLPSVAPGHSCVKSSTSSSRSRSWLHLQKQARSSKLTQLCRLIWRGITIFQCVVYQYEFFRMFFIFYSLWGSVLYCAQSEVFRMFFILHTLVSPASRSVSQTIRSLGSSILLYCLGQLI